MTPEELRQNALHEAISFLAFRTPLTANGRDGGVRVPEVADVAARFEHYLRTGTMPLERDWVPPEPPPAMLYRGAELPPDEEHPEIPARRCGLVDEHTPHDHNRGGRSRWCDGKPVEITQASDTTF